MNSETQENFAIALAIQLAPTIIRFDGTTEEMNASAVAWVERSRNLAKLWASKAPVDPAVASGLTSGKDLTELSLEEIGQQAHQEQTLRRKRK